VLENQGGMNELDGLQVQALLGQIGALKL
jgi:hypothetical protein